MTEATKVLTALSPGRWKLNNADETWLPSLIHHGSIGNPAETTLAVVREHPQNDDVLLSGTKAELLDGTHALQEELAQLVLKVKRQKRDDSAFLAPNYRIANMVRRALQTRPLTYAITEVVFGAGVASIEYEPLAAHRLGQLGFTASSVTQARVHECPIIAPAGADALSLHLQLPPDIALAPGCGHVPIGLRALEAEPSKDGNVQNLQHLGTATLRASSVYRSKHAKFQTIAMIAYEPEIRIVNPPQDAKAKLLEAGYVLRIGNVVSSNSPHITSVRRERILQVLPGVVIEAPPRSIRVDFEPLVHRSKREALLVALDQLQSEVTEFTAALASLQ